MSSSQGVIFLKKKNVNGESKWFEDGDEENDGKYVGEIENGKPNGTGSITFPDGRKHVGEFKDGKPNGQGTLTLPKTENVSNEKCKLVTKSWTLEVHELGKQNNCDVRCGDFVKGVVECSKGAEKN